MTPSLPPLTIGRCSVSSRSFLLGPDGPAGAPPGQALRSGALIGLRENREQKQDPYYKSPRFEGNPVGKFKPHDDRHTHATWLDAANLNKVIQMDRRGHSMPGMDAVYNHITTEMRQQLCDVLEELWDQAVTQRRQLSPASAVPILNDILA